MSAEDVVGACRNLANHHREIILTGIHIGQYRDPATGVDLMDLVELLVNRIRDVRFRISSIDPTKVDARLVALIDSGRVCRHIHLSIQSCSDDVLKAMGRGYRASEVERAAMLLASGIPQVAVTGDVIAGFPGETDAMHESTAAMLASLPMAGLHIFPFSERKGTRASLMDGKLSHGVIRERAAVLREIALAKRKKFLNSLVGASLGVIVTGRAADAAGNVEAFSDNAVSVGVPSGVVGYGGAGRAKITGVENLKVTGIWE
jgi:threonylcarbamoyladenosine tRNA methylthiotransferase MtaB